MISTPNSYESLTERKIVSCCRQCSSHLSSSDVPHTHADAVGRLHRKELGPLGLRAVGNLDDTLAGFLLAVHPRRLTLSYINVRSCTVGCQVSVVDRGNCTLLAEVLDGQE